MTGLLEYDIAPGKVRAFSTMRDAVPPVPAIAGHQVHGVRIAFVPDMGATREELEGYDAFVTNVRGCAIAVRTADCIPVLLYDPVHCVVAAIHSGWKGTLGRISQKTITAMSDRYGTVPGDLRAVIGPGICGECFQVGPEVVQAFRENGFDMERIYRWMGPVAAGNPQYSVAAGNPRTGHHLDLFEANRLLLVQSGLQEDSILVSGICTFTDARFFSARREGVQCGRILNVIVLE